LVLDRLARIWEFVEGMFAVECTSRDLLGDLGSNVALERDRAATMLQRSIRLPR
jgi:hypothetical protein